MKTSILLSLHREAGAQLTRGEPPLLLSYGEVPGEYRAGIENVLLFDQTSRGLLSVRGGERAVFLHRLLAGEVRGLAAHQGNRNLLLSPKGKVLFDFDLWVEESEILISTEVGRENALLDALENYHFSEDVDIRDSSHEHAPIALSGPRSAALLARVLGGVVPPSYQGDRAAAHRAVTIASFEGQRVRVGSLEVAGSPGLRVDGGPELAPRLWKALLSAGATAGGQVAYDILRVEAGAAEPGIDVDENVYPQEARLERAFRLDKGCFVGQEVVAKIDTYGGLNKRLCGLRVSHDDPIPRGTRLLQAEGGELRDLGMTTSWAYSFALDTGMVLAYVKRRHQAPGTVFQLAGEAGEATLIAIPVRENAVPVTGDSE